MAKRKTTKEQTMIYYTEIQRFNNMKPTKTHVLRKGKLFLAFFRYKRLLKTWDNLIINL